MDDDKLEDAVHRVEIRGDLDRQAVEALYLEIRRLAERRGIAIENFRVKTVCDGENSGVS